MSQIPPFLSHHAHTSAGLLAHSDAPHCCRNRWIPDLLLTRLEQTGIITEYIARVPEDDAIAKELDNPLATMITVVLMNQKIHSGFTKDTETGRIVAPAKRIRINIPTTPAGI